MTKTFDFDSAPTFGLLAAGAHHIAFRVYYEDTDAGGIVYHANYLRFCERARTEALRMLGIHQSERFSNTGGGFVVGRLSMEFRAPLKLDDVVRVETSLQELRKVRMSMLQQLFRGGAEVARVTVEIVMTGPDGRAAAIPADIAESLAKHFGPSPRAQQE